MDWLTLTEMVVGLALRREISATPLDPGDFFGEYGNLVRMLQDGKTETQIAAQYLDLFQAAQHAYSSLNGTGNLDWVQQLRQKAALSKQGKLLEKIAIDWQNGANDPELDRVRNIVQNVDLGTGGDWVDLADVSDDGIRFLPTGWPNLDKFTRGIPEVGVIPIGAMAKTGKSSLGILIGDCFSLYHDKAVGFVSLEMSASQLKGRHKQMFGKEIDRDRILIYEKPASARDVILFAAKIDNLGLVIIDFIDLLKTTGEMSEPVMRSVYTTLHNGSRELGVPILAFAQISGKYQGGIPHPDQLYWTALAKAITPLTMMLYNPAVDFYPGNEHRIPVRLSNYAYIVIQLARYGLADGYETPGCIGTPFKGEKAWAWKPGPKKLKREPGLEPRWFSLL